MKKNVLMTSASLIVLATTLSVGALLLSHNAENIARLTGVSCILGLGSIGLFFVGLALKE